MIQLDRVEKQYGDQMLFRELSWQLNPGQRIGLIGPNGAGKSTIFGMLVGDVEPDKGRVVVPRDTSIGLLPQELEELADTPILDFALQGGAELIALEEQIAAMTAALHSVAPDDVEASTAKLGALHERYEHGGGYQLRPQAKSILTGMGFHDTDFGRSASELSGGWRMRLALAKLLLQRPDVLLMDEPTNHLDVPSLEWLEEFLQGYEGTLVVISHDRYFLDRLVSEIAAFEVDGFHTHKGNYSAYEKVREVHLEHLRQVRVQQEKKIKQTERFIERFRYKNTKARQVQSRVKALEKIDLVELPSERKKVTFRFPEAPRAGKTVCRCEDVAVRYGDNSVYEGLDYEVYRGERIALVGPNGEGKTTLLRLLTGELAPTLGEVVRGHQVLTGYFAQHQVEALDLSRTVLEELQAHATNESHPQCRKILGAFLFSGDDVEKPVAVISGGERSRVALAKLLLRPVNLLLLDEPTNHLDMASRDVLVEALQSFKGTLIFVSHDRRFINSLATRVVHVENGACVDYPGDYDYYRYKRGQERAGTQSGADLERPVAAGSKATRKEEKRRAAERRNELYKKLNPAKQALTAVEKEIAEREAAVEASQTEMADPELYKEPDRLRELSQEHGENKARLAELYDEWVELTDQIEQASR